MTILSGTCATAGHYNQFKIDQDHKIILVHGVDDASHKIETGAVLHFGLGLGHIKMKTGRSKSSSSKKNET